MNKRLQRMVACLNVALLVVNLLTPFSLLPPREVQAVECLDFDDYGQCIKANEATPKPIVTPMPRPTVTPRPTPSLRTPPPSRRGDCPIGQVENAQGNCIKRPVAVSLISPTGASCGSGVAHGAYICSSGTTCVQCVNGYFSKNVQTGAACASAKGTCSAPKPPTTYPGQGCDIKDGKPGVPNGSYVCATRYECVKCVDGRYSSSTSTGATCIGAKGLCSDGVPRPTRQIYINDEIRDVNCKVWCSGCGGFCGDSNPNDSCVSQAKNRCEEEPCWAYGSGGCSSYLVKTANCVNDDGTACYAGYKNLRQTDGLFQVLSYWAGTGKKCPDGSDKKNYNESTGAGQCWVDPTSKVAQEKAATMGAQAQIAVNATAQINNQVVLKKLTDELGVCVGYATTAEKEVCRLAAINKLKPSEEVKAIANEQYKNNNNYATLVAAIDAKCSSKTTVIARQHCEDEVVDDYREFSYEVMQAARDESEKSWLTNSLTEKVKSRCGTSYDNSSYNSCANFVFKENEASPEVRASVLSQVTGESNFNSLYQIAMNGEAPGSIVITDKIKSDCLKAIQAKGGRASSCSEADLKQTALDAIKVQFPNQFSQVFVAVGVNDMVNSITSGNTYRLKVACQQDQEYLQSRSAVGCTNTDAYASYLLSTSEFIDVLGDGVINLQQFVQYGAVGENKYGEVASSECGADFYLNIEKKVCVRRDEKTGEILEAKNVDSGIDPKIGLFGIKTCSGTARYDKYLDSCVPSLNPKQTVVGSCEYSSSGSFGATSCGPGYKPANLSRYRCECIPVEGGLTSEGKIANWFTETVPAWFKGIPEREEARLATAQQILMDNYAKSCADRIRTMGQAEAMKPPTTSTCSGDACRSSIPQYNPCIQYAESKAAADYRMTHADSNVLVSTAEEREKLQAYIAREVYSLGEQVREADSLISRNNYLDDIYFEIKNAGEFLGNTNGVYNNSKIDAAYSLFGDKKDIDDVMLPDGTLNKSLFTEAEIQQIEDQAKLIRDSLISNSAAYGLTKSAEEYAINRADYAAMGYEYPPMTVVIKEVETGKTYDPKTQTLTINTINKVVSAESDVKKAGFLGLSYQWSKNYADERQATYMREQIESGSVANFIAQNTGWNMSDPSVKRFSELDSGTQELVKIAVAAQSDYAHQYATNWGVRSATSIQTGGAFVVSFGAAIIAGSFSGGGLAIAAQAAADAVYDVTTAVIINALIDTPQDRLAAALEAKEVDARATGNDGQADFYRNLSMDARRSADQQAFKEAATMVAMDVGFNFAGGALGNAITKANVSKQLLPGLTDAMIKSGKVEVVKASATITKKMAEEATRDAAEAAAVKLLDDIPLPSLLNRELNERAFSKSVMEQLRAGGLEDVAKNFEVTDAFKKFNDFPVKPGMVLVDDGGKVVPITANSKIIIRNEANEQIGKSIDGFTANTNKKLFQPKFNEVILTQAKSIEVDGVLLKYDSLHQASPWEKMLAGFSSGGTKIADSAKELPIKVGSIDLDTAKSVVDAPVPAKGTAEVGEISKVTPEADVPKKADARAPPRYNNEEEVVAAVKKNEVKPGQRVSIVDVDGNVTSTKIVVKDGTVLDINQLSGVAKGSNLPVVGDFITKGVGSDGTFKVSNLIEVKKPVIPGEKLVIDKQLADIASDDSGVVVVKSTYIEEGNIKNWEVKSDLGSADKVDINKWMEEQLGVNPTTGKLLPDAAPINKEFEGAVIGVKAPDGSVQHWAVTKQEEVLVPKRIYENPTPTGLKKWYADVQQRLNPTKAEHEASNTFDDLLLTKGGEDIRKFAKEYEFKKLELAKLEAKPKTKAVNMEIKGFKEHIQKLETKFDEIINNKSINDELRKGVDEWKTSLDNEIAAAVNARTLAQRAENLEKFVPTKNINDVLETDNKLEIILVGGQFWDKTGKWEKARPMYVFKSDVIPTPAEISAVDYVNREILDKLADVSGFAGLRFDQADSYLKAMNLLDADGKVLLTLPTGGGKNTAANPLIFKQWLTEGQNGVQMFPEKLLDENIELAKKLKEYYGTPIYVFKQVDGGKRAFYDLAGEEVDAAAVLKQVKNKDKGVLILSDYSQVSYGLNDVKMMRGKIGEQVEDTVGIAKVWDELSRPGNNTLASGDELGEVAGGRYSTPFGKKSSIGSLKPGDKMAYNLKGGGEDVIKIHRDTKDLTLITQARSGEIKLLRDANGVMKPFDPEKNVELLEEILIKVKKNLEVDPKKNEIALRKIEEFLKITEKGKKNREVALKFIEDFDGLRQMKPMDFDGLVYRTIGEDAPAAMKELTAQMNAYTSSAYSRLDAMSKIPGNDFSMQDGLIKLASGKSVTGTEYSDVMMKMALQDEGSRMLKMETESVALEELIVSGRSIITTTDELTRVFKGFIGMDATDGLPSAQLGLRKTNVAQKLHPPKSVSIAKDYVTQAEQVAEASVAKMNGGKIPVIVNSDVYGRSLDDASADLVNASVRKLEANEKMVVAMMDGDGTNKLYLVGKDGWEKRISLDEKVADATKLYEQALAEQSNSGAKGILAISENRTRGLNFKPATGKANVDEIFVVGNIDDAIADVTRQAAGRLRDVDNPPYSFFAKADGNSELAIEIDNLIADGDMDRAISKILEQININQKQVEEGFNFQRGLAELRTNQRSLLEEIRAQAGSNSKLKQVLDDLDDQVSENEWAFTSIARSQDPLDIYHAEYAQVRKRMETILEIAKENGLSDDVVAQITSKFSLDGKMIELDPFKKLVAMGPDATKKLTGYDERAVAFLTDVTKVEEVVDGKKVVKNIVDNQIPTEIFQGSAGKTVAVSETAADALVSSKRVSEAIANAVGSVNLSTKNAAKKLATAAENALVGIGFPPALAAGVVANIGLAAASHSVAEMVSRAILQNDVSEVRGLSVTHGTQGGAAAVLRSYIPGTEEYQLMIDVNKLINDAKSGRVSTSNEVAAEFAVALGKLGIPPLDANIILDYAGATSEDIAKVAMKDEGAVLDVNTTSVEDVTTAVDEQVTTSEEETTSESDVATTTEENTAETNTTTDEDVGEVAENKVDEKATESQKETTTTEKVKEVVTKTTEVIKNVPTIAVAQLTNVQEEAHAWKDIPTETQSLTQKLATALDKRVQILGESTSAPVKANVRSQLEEVANQEQFKTITYENQFDILRSSMLDRATNKVIQTWSRNHPTTAWQKIGNFVVSVAAYTATVNPLVRYIDKNAQMPIKILDTIVWGTTRGVLMYFTWPVGVAVLTFDAVKTVAWALPQVPATRKILANVGLVNPVTREWDREIVRGRVLGTTSGAIDASLGYAESIKLRRMKLTVWSKAFSQFIGFQRELEQGVAAFLTKLNDPAMSQQYAEREKTEKSPRTEDLSKELIKIANNPKGNYTDLSVEQRITLAELSVQEQLLAGGIGTILPVITQGPVAGLKFNPATTRGVVDVIGRRWFSRMYRMPGVIDEAKSVTESTEMVSESVAEKPSVVMDVNKVNSEVEKIQQKFPSAKGSQPSTYDELPKYQAPANADTVTLYRGAKDLSEQQLAQIFRTGGLSEAEIIELTRLMRSNKKIDWATVYKDHQANMTGNTDLFVSATTQLRNALAYGSGYVLRIEIPVDTLNELKPIIPSQIQADNLENEVAFLGYIPSEYVVESIEITSSLKSEIDMIRKNYGKQLTPQVSSLVDASVFSGTRDEFIIHFEAQSMALLDQIIGEEASKYSDQALRLAKTMVVNEVLEVKHQNLEYERKQMVEAAKAIQVKAEKEAGDKALVDKKIQEELAQKIRDTRAKLQAANDIDSLKQAIIEAETFNPATGRAVIAVAPAKLKLAELEKARDQLEAEKAAAIKAAKDKEALEEKVRLDEAEALAQKQRDEEQARLEQNQFLQEAWKTAGKTVLNVMSIMPGFTQALDLAIANADRIGAVLPAQGQLILKTLLNGLPDTAGQQAAIEAQMEEEEAARQFEALKQQNSLQNQLEAARARLQNAHEKWKQRNLGWKVNLSESVNQKHTVIGDVHGDLDGLRVILRDTGLVDVQGNWIGGTQTLVFMGDVIDRGSQGVAVDVYIRNLQQQAANQGGNVVRLLGNHELMFMEGMAGNESSFGDWIRNGGGTVLKELGISESGTISMNNTKLQKLFNNLTSDITNGNIVASYVAGGRIFVHAGVAPQLSKGQDVASLSDMFNKDLVEAVKTSTFTNRIFNVSSSRRGDDEFGGIFWSDYERDLLSSGDEFALVPQIVGHTPERLSGAEVRVSPNQKIVNVDVGIYRSYGSNRGYITLENNAIEGYSLEQLAVAADVTTLDDEVRRLEQEISPVEAGKNIPSTPDQSGNVSQQGPPVQTITLNPSSHLLVTSGTTYTAKVSDFSGNSRINIGRDDASTLTFMDDHVSRNHAQIYFKTDSFDAQNQQVRSWVVKNVNTSNGLKVDGSTVRNNGAVRITKGTIITLYGDIQIQVLAVAGDSINFKLVDSKEKVLVSDSDSGAMSGDVSPLVAPLVVAPSQFYPQALKESVNRLAEATPKEKVALGEIIDTWDEWGLELQGLWNKIQMAKNKKDVGVYRQALEQALQISRALGYDVVGVEYDKQFRLADGTRGGFQVEDGQWNTVRMGKSSIFGKKKFVVAIKDDSGQVKIDNLFRGYEGDGWWADDLLENFAHDLGAAATRGGKEVAKDSTARIDPYVLADWLGVAPGFVAQEIGTILDDRVRKPMVPTTWLFDALVDGRVNWPATGVTNEVSSKNKPVLLNSVNPIGLGMVANWFAQTALPAVLPIVNMIPGSVWKQWGQLMPAISGMVRGWAEAKIPKQLSRQNNIQNRINRFSELTVDEKVAVGEMINSLSLSGEEYVTLRSFFRNEENATKYFRRLLTSENGGQELKAALFIQNRFRKARLIIPELAELSDGPYVMWKDVDGHQEKITTILVSLADHPQLIDKFFSYWSRHKWNNNTIGSVYSRMLEPGGVEYLTSFIDSVERVKQVGLDETLVATIYSELYYEKLINPQILSLMPNRIVSVATILNRLRGIGRLYFRFSGGPSFARFDVRKIARQFLNDPAFLDQERLIVLVERLNDLEKIARRWNFKQNGTNERVNLSKEMIAAIVSAPIVSRAIDTALSLELSDFGLIQNGLMREYGTRPGELVFDLELADYPTLLFRSVLTSDNPVTLLWGFQERISIFQYERNYYDGMIRDAFNGLVRQVSDPDFLTSETYSVAQLQELFEVVKIDERSLYNYLLLYEKVEAIEPIRRFTQSIKDSYNRARALQIILVADNLETTMSSLATISNYLALQALEADHLTQLKLIADRLSQLHLSLQHNEGLSDEESLNVVKELAKNKSGFMTVLLDDDSNLSTIRDYYSLVWNKISPISYRLGRDDGLTYFAQHLDGKNENSMIAVITEDLVRSGKFTQEYYKLFNTAAQSEVMVLLTPEVNRFIKAYSAFSNNPLIGNFLASRISLIDTYYIDDTFTDIFYRDLVVFDSKGFVSFAGKEQWIKAFGADLIKNFLGALPVGLSDEARNAFSHNDYDRTSAFLLKMLENTDRSGFVLTAEDLNIITAYISEFGLSNTPQIFHYYKNLTLFNQGKLTSLPPEIAKSGLRTVPELLEKIKDTKQKIVGEKPLTRLASLSSLDEELIGIATNHSIHRWTITPLDQIVGDYTKDKRAGKIKPIARQYSAKTIDLPLISINTTSAFSPTFLAAYKEVSNEILTSLEDSQNVGSLQTTLVTILSAKLEELRLSLDPSLSSYLFIQKQITDLQTMIETARRSRSADELMGVLVTINTRSYGKWEKPLVSLMRQLALRQLFIRRGDISSGGWAEEIRNLLSGDPTAQSLSEVMTIIDIHIKDHVLNIQNNNEEKYWSTETFNLIKANKKRNNINDYFLPYLDTFREAINNLIIEDQPDKIVVSMIPDKGIVGEMAGYLAGVCYTKVYPLLSQFSNLTPFKFVLSNEKSGEKELLGSALVFEVLLEDGSRAMVIRAFDVRNEAEMDIGAFFEQFVNHVAEIGSRRGISKVLVAGTSGTVSNYPMTTNYVLKNYVTGKTPTLVRDNFNFNGYDITKSLYEVRDINLLGPGLSQSVIGKVVESVVSIDDGQQIEHLGGFSPLALTGIAGTTLSIPVVGQVVAGVAITPLITKAVRWVMGKASERLPDSMFIGNMAKAATNIDEWVWGVPKLLERYRAKPVNKDVSVGVQTFSIDQRYEVSDSMASQFEQLWREGTPIYGAYDVDNNSFIVADSQTQLKPYAGAINDPSRHVFIWEWSRTNDNPGRYILKLDMGNQIGDSPDFITSNEALTTFASFVNTSPVRNTTQFEIAGHPYKAMFSELIERKTINNPTGRFRIIGDALDKEKLSKSLGQTRQYYFPDHTLLSFYGVHLGEQEWGYGEVKLIWVSDGASMFRIENDQDFTLWVPVVARQLLQFGLDPAMQVEFTGTEDGWGTTYKSTLMATATQMDLTKIGKGTDDPSLAVTDTITIRPGEIYELTDGRKMGIIAIDPLGRMVRFRFAGDAVSDYGYRKLSYEDFLAEHHPLQSGVVNRWQRQDVLVSSMRKNDYSEAYFKDDIAKKGSMIGLVDRSGRVSWSIAEGVSHNQIMGRMSLFDTDVLARFQYIPETRNWVISGNSDDIVALMATLVEVGGVSSLAQFSVTALDLGQGGVRFDGSAQLVQKQVEVAARNAWKLAPIQTRANELMNSRAKLVGLRPRLMTESEADYTKHLAQVEEVWWIANKTGRDFPTQRYDESIESYLKKIQPSSMNTLVMNELEKPTALSLKERVNASLARVANDILGQYEWEARDSRVSGSMLTHLAWWSINAVIAFREFVRGGTRTPDAELYRQFHLSAPTITSAFQYFWYQHIGDIFEIIVFTMLFRLLLAIPALFSKTPLTSLLVRRKFYISAGLGTALVTIMELMGSSTADPLDLFGIGVGVLSTVGIWEVLQALLVNNKWLVSLAKKLPSVGKRVGKLTQAIARRIWELLTRFDKWRVSKGR